LKLRLRVLTLAGVMVFDAGTTEMYRRVPMSGLRNRRWMIAGSALIAGVLVAITYPKAGAATLDAGGVMRAAAQPAEVRAAAPPAGVRAAAVPAEVRAAAPPGGVFFQDEGTVRGWDNFPQRPQKKGVLRTVTSPTFKGGTAIEARQTYVNEGGGYHSETVDAAAQRVGEDRYFGQAIFLPANWQFHNQNVTFQQFSPEKPSGPWLLMFVQNDEIRFGGSGGIRGTVGKIKRGTWIRIVVRLKLHPTNGAFEVYLNGKKTVSQTNRTVLPKTSNSIRWSSGIYCTGWREGKPAGQSQLSIFHDHARIAASYNLAEPANW